jgi:hypothetical protein
MWPDACAECWNTCVDELPQEPARRPRIRVGARAPYSDPNIDYALPKTVGATQIAYSAAWPRDTAMLDHFTTKEVLDELASHGIRAVKLFIAGVYWDGVEHPTNPLLYPDYPIIFEDMHEVWEHPDIDVFVITFMNYGHASWARGCDGGWELEWPNEPTYEIAKFLFKHFGDQDKTIIIAGSEIDNQWRGFGCNDPEDAMWDSWPQADIDACLAEKTQAECAYDLSMDRMRYATREIQRRQREVEKARSEHPDATIRIRTSVNISVTSRRAKYYFTSFMHEMYNEMEYWPDYVGLTHFKGDNTTLAQAVKNIQRLIGYPVERIYLDQFGTFEKTEGKQYPVIYNKGVDGFNLGINSMFVWMWRQTWHRFTSGGVPLNRGMFQWLTTEGRVEWGAPTSGLQAIYELNTQYGDYKEYMEE